MFYTFICVQNAGNYDTYVIPLDNWDDFVNVFIDDVISFTHHKNIGVYELNHFKYSVIICLRNT